MVCRGKFLNWEALAELGFNFEGGMWFHSQHPNLAIKLDSTCFYVSFHGYLAKHPYNLTVGELERQFYERTGKLLF